jgi:ABC-2 type transport system permease protein
VSVVTESPSAHADAPIGAAGTMAGVLEPVERRRPSGLSTSLTFGWRALLKLKHLPEQLFDVTVFPVILTVMFTYLFGGALAGSPMAYLDYVLPGIVVMSTVMITFYTGISVNTDIATGFFDRIRSLPVWRPSAMIGYLLSDMVRYVIGVIVIVAVGYALGYRVGSVVGTLAGVGLLLVFSFAVSWLWTLFGLLLGSAKTVMAASQLVLFPMTFLSNVFVRPETMPEWLETAVNLNPITHVVQAVRDLMGGVWNSSEITWVLVASAVMVVTLGSATMWVYNRK